MFEINPLIRAEALERREYQLALAEKALTKNTLIVLPTALGKTIIAALVASHFLYNYRRSKVLIMAPTRPLVLQHSETFMRLLKLKSEDFQVLTGKNPPSFRLYAWRGNARVYFATPQVVSNDHELGLKLDEFSLIVFDECHRARKNYAYTKVAKAYVEEAPHPIILGITASPGGKKEKIREICDALFIERVEARTEEDPDVKPYVSPIAMEWKFVRLPESYLNVRKTLKRMLEERLERLSRMGAVKKDPNYIFRTDLLKAGEEIRYMIEEAQLEGERGRLFSTLMLISSALTIYHALELLESQGGRTLSSFLDRVGNGEKASHRAIAHELRSLGIYDAVKSLEEHPKFEMLKEALVEQFSEKNDSKVIVFTQYRDTASHLVEKLSGLGMPARRFVGQADKLGDYGLSQDEQASILNEFKRGDVKVLVATSIGEEGLDIPSVDMVVFYEPVPSEIRYIQRRGRTGRGRFGKVIILATEGSFDMAYLRASRKMAERMKEIVKGLNSELKGIMRLAPMPAPDPMRAEEIAEVEEYAQAAPKPEAEEVELIEKERVKEFNAEVRLAARRIFDMVLRSGGKGTSLTRLSEEFEGEGMAPSVIRAAVEKLCDENQVEKVGGRIFPAGLTLLRNKPRDVHTFRVEKVLPGKAILFVDGKWRAVLEAEDYSGPRHLIKKGAEFRAAADLFRQDGKLHARVYAVEAALGS
jgi:Fanconi anemia group M protein